MLVRDRGATECLPWHTSEPIPPIVLSQRVLTIQADGDELEQILDALKPKKRED